MNKLKLLFYNSLFVLFLSLMCGCVSYKQVPYFQDVKAGSITEEKIENFTGLVIQPADILGINVSSRNPESSAILNYNLTRANGNNYNTSPDNPVTGYRVDADGFIHLPLIGNFKVAGYTTDQISVRLDSALLTYYKDPVSNVRIINFKVYVFGDVQKPNVYILQNEQTSVIDALTMAGDLNITGLRKNVMLIRTENGVRKYISLDITSKNLMQSPYFYLKNNDQIYVTPGKAKFTTANDQGFRIATLVLAALSIVAILIAHNYN